MLVLTRRAGEGIVIAGSIRLVVLGVKGKKTRLGITAPQSIRVDRSEVHTARAIGLPAPTSARQPPRAAHLTH